MDQNTPVVENIESKTIEEKPKMKKFKLRYIFIPLAVILGLLLVTGVYGFFVARSMMPDINALQETGTKLSTAFQGQDLATSKMEIKTLSQLHQRWPARP